MTYPRRTVKFLRRAQVATRGRQAEVALGRTPNKVIKMAEFIMPSFQSTSSTTNVRTSLQHLFGLLMSELGKKIDDSQKFTQETLLTLTLIELISSIRVKV